MVKFSLRNKLLFFSVLIALIPLGIAAYTNISITRDELKSSVNEETSMVADNLSKDIDEMYQDIWSAPLLLIRNAVDNENLGATEKEAILKNFINDVPDIVSIELTAEGVPTPLLLVAQEIFIQKLDEAGLDPISVVRVSPESISRLLDTERVSNPDLTYIPETDTWMLTMVLSMERKIFKRAVTLSARVNLDRLKDRIAHHNKTRSSTITLVDMTGKKIFDPKRPDLTELAIVKSALRLLASGSRAISVEPYTRPTGDKMLGAFSFPKFIDWAVIVEETEADAYIAITKMVLRLIIMAFLAFCLAALVAIWVAQRISRPIVKIGKVAQLVGRGDFTVRVSGIKTRDEINDLGQRMNEMIEGLHERFQLQKFVSNQTIDAIKGADEKGVKLGGQRKKATVFFSDIRGFTEFSEKVEPEVVIEMLNTYLRVQASIVREFNGDIDKYVGDELIALFQGEDMVQNAVLAAVEIQTQTAALNEAHPEWDIGIGIGINTGEMVMGAMGSEDRMDFTILGDAVNLGSRLCSHATRDQILLTEASCEEIEGITWIQTDKLDPIMVKGKSHPIPIYEVVGAQPQTKERRYARAEVGWPCTLRTAAHKSINAELRDISAGGALVYLQDQLQLDETCQIVIKVPDGKSLETAIEVVWSDIIEEDKPHRIGAKFIKISQEDRRFLLEVISRIRARTADHQKM
jgi:adenylate cyclase